MGAPQIIWICAVAFSLGVEIAKHGEPKTGKHDGFVQLIGTILGGYLLYWGGFFS